MGGLFRLSLYLSFVCGVNGVRVFGKKGLTDWVVQRCSAVFIVVYVFALLGYDITIADSADLHAWAPYLFSPSMVVLGLLAFLAIMVHALIGIWTVCTDYVPDQNLQVSVLLITYLMIIFSCTWAILILAS